MCWNNDGLPVFQFYLRILVYHVVDKRMSGTSVLAQTRLLSPPKNPPQNTEFNFGLNEQKCLSLLKKCNSMEEFKQVHAQILKLGLFWDSFCASNPLATCALTNWGSLEYACSIFRRIEEPGSFEFNAMIRGYVKNMNLEEALLVYEEMLQRGVEPDNFTHPPLLKACSLLGALQEGKQIHGHAFKEGLEDDIFLQNSFISMYAKCKQIDRARAVFEKMDEKSIASWSAIIGAHASVEMWQECLELFGDMSNKGCWRAEESTLVMCSPHVTIWVLLILEGAFMEFYSETSVSSMSLLKLR